jgi:hypothetical protein
MLKKLGVSNGYGLNAHNRSFSYYQGRADKCWAIADLLEQFSETRSVVERNASDWAMIARIRQRLANAKQETSWLSADYWRGKADQCRDSAEEFRAVPEFAEALDGEARDLEAMARWADVSEH